MAERGAYRCDGDNKGCDVFGRCGTPPSMVPGRLELRLETCELGGCGLDPVVGYEFQEVGAGYYTYGSVSLDCYECRVRS